MVLELVDRDAVAPSVDGLVVTGVSLTDSTSCRLQGISFHAPPGSLTAVIGPSGCGKTSLARVLSGELGPTAGAVSFDGLDVHRRQSVMRRRIGVVPQEDVVHRQLLVREALTFGAQLRLPHTSEADRQEAVSRVLEELELCDRAGRRIDTLSGGQRKRVSVALELLTEPALLILDEPTSGLDPALDRRVMSLLRGLADAGRVVIVITHSLTYLDVCDQVLLIAPGGRPAFCGAPGEVSAHIGASDWADIYTLISLDSDRPEDAGIYSAEKRRVRRPRNITQKCRPPVGEQFAVIFRRQIRLVLADRQYLVFLTVMPVILGLLSLAVAGDAGLGLPDGHVRWPNEAPQLLSLLLIGTTFMGNALSLRDLMSERAVFLRERAIGLSVTAYLLGKMAVFGVAVSAQVVVLFTIVLLGKSHPDQGAVVLWDARAELLVALVVTGFVAAIMGLAMSAFARSHEQLLPMLVVVIMAQIVFSGGLIPVTDREVLEQMSWLFPARWGFAATAATVDLHRIAPLVPAGEVLWNHDARWWWASIGLLVIQALILTAIVRWRLRAAAHDEPLGNRALLRVTGPGRRFRNLFISVFQQHS